MTAAASRARWDDMVARYAWADADEFDAYTVSVTAGKTEDEVIRAFGGDPGASRPAAFTGAQEEQTSSLHEVYGLLHVLGVGRHVVTMEAGGYHGTVPEIAMRVSAGGGDFFSVYASVNARYGIMRARDGRLDGSFDPFELEDADWMDPRPEVPAWAQGVDFHMGTLNAESFALMERTMGVAFDPRWLATPVRTVELAAP
ncbi:DUF6461 domain-containing protein [Streptomyces sp. VRA16 Mangrove soil]|uniref:DUF6461 domain-containing protein n=1 Tax=Streptomyces sp. VRA16 Mangrove soil TaxID=2817434 RepID=UPI001A9DA215|nr:DUF6461 domain-containing protein [Streptomyces sp. VRA16 Mangrove soil]MBO1335439.1 hypothetical protein [Streptomyces sp. VRA16 Mangrove soil]